MSYPVKNYLLKDKEKPFGYIALAGDSELPAIGGCRLIRAAFSDEGKSLCTELAITMDKKARLASLPLSGGKAVLYIQDQKHDEYYFQLFAKKLNELKGKYITAVDIGTTEKVMNVLSKYTSYVTCDTKSGGDPSFYTAKTVLTSIQEAAFKRYGSHSLESKKIVIQGAGKVGLALIKLLNNLSSQIEVVVSDLKEINLGELKARFIPSKNIFQEQCQIFIPAAGSLCISEKEIADLSCDIFASAANNPFIDKICVKRLEEKGVIFLEDCLINGGGLICCAYQYGILNNIDLAIEKVRKKVGAYLCGL
jgi:leucine dehydrogenase